jgi:predicted AAA+ superfamily ATPase
MKRLIYSQLQNWKKALNRKPLVLRGARQVGKSYIVKEFGQKDFKTFVRIDFLSQKDFHLLFSEEKSLRPQDILKEINFLTKKEINPSEALLFFDEIQECPGALTSLKFFQEEMPELAIIAAGNYLGIMSNEDSFPVGKVDFLEMSPMNFDEFLEAFDKKLHKIYGDIDVLEHSKISPVYHQTLLDAWRTYLAIGGMPEVVSSFLQNKDTHILNAFRAARTIQDQLLIGYRADFAKHAGFVNASHILNVFNAVAIQLSKAYDEEVKKFSFTGVVPNQKGFERIRGPLTWLIKSRLVLKNIIVSKAHHPLKSYSSENKFKLYYLDIGLLSAALEIPIEVIMSDQIGSYKGFIAENFVAQELFSQSNHSLYSWTEGQSEVEFLIINEGNIIPLEVKSSDRSVRAKSLDSYIARYSPQAAYKVSPQNRGYDVNRKMITMPIYLTGKLAKN